MLVLPGKINLPIFAKNHNNEIFIFKNTLKFKVFIAALLLKVLLLIYEQAYPLIIKRKLPCEIKLLNHERRHSGLPERPQTA